MRGLRETGENGKARESKACPISGNRRVSAPDSGASRGIVNADRGVSPGSPLPDATADFVEAAGLLAAAAMERGDRAEARRLLEGALRAVEGHRAQLRVVPGA